MTIGHCLATFLITCQQAGAGCHKAEQAQLTQPLPQGSVTTPCHRGGIVLNLLQFIHIFLVLKQGGVWMQYSRCGLTSAEWRGTFLLEQLLFPRAQPCLHHSEIHKAPASQLLQPAHVPLGDIPVSQAHPLLTPSPSLVSPANFMSNCGLLDLQVTQNIKQDTSCSKQWGTPPVTSLHVSYNQLAISNTITPPVFTRLVIHLPRS